jgi:NAD(P)-dependent dehydrogenase (short-subunit alcohol dehydrogenase family)
MSARQSTTLPPQRQEHQPGESSRMNPQPEYDDPGYRGCGKLDQRVAIVTGGDSGIGRAVAIAFAKEGADVAIVYLEEDRDAEETKEAVERYGQACLTIKGDVSDRATCERAVQETLDEFARLDILVNNAGQQFEQHDIERISPEQLEHTFATNIFSQFYITQAALKHMDRGAAIVNTASVTAYKGKPSLVDYSATKGAIVAFTRSLALQLVERGIRVNAVAPGPIWTPLIPASFSAEEVAHFGEDTPMGRPGQPREVAPSYVFLASEDASYMTGQTLHPNGGQPVES